MRWRTSFSAPSGQPVVALHDRLSGLGERVQIDRRFGGGVGRTHFCAGAAVRLGKPLLDLRVMRLDRRVAIVGARRLNRQLAPRQLSFERIGRIDDPPMIDRTGRAGADAIHAGIAFFGINNDVDVVMADRVNRAHRLAGVAADAEFRINQVLAEGRGHGIELIDFDTEQRRFPQPSKVAGLVPAIRTRTLSSRRRGTTTFVTTIDLLTWPTAWMAGTSPAMTAKVSVPLYAICSLTYSKSPGLLSMPTFGEAIQPANLPGSKQGFISDWM